MLKKIFGKKEGSASAAKERLKIVIERQRGSRQGNEDFQRDLYQAVLAVMKKHFEINEVDLDVQVKTETPDSSEMELNIDIHGVKEKSPKKS